MSEKIELIRLNLVSYFYRVNLSIERHTHTPLTKRNRNPPPPQRTPMPCVSLKASTARLPWLSLAPSPSPGDLLLQSPSPSVGEPAVCILCSHPSPAPLLCARPRASPHVARLPDGTFPLTPTPSSSSTDSTFLRRRDFPQRRESLGPASRVPDGNRESPAPRALRCGLRRLVSGESHRCGITSPGSR
jgi:hypothetical protein